MSNPKHLPIVNAVTLNIGPLDLEVTPLEAQDQVPPSITAVLDDREAHQKTREQLDKIIEAYREVQPTTAVFAAMGMPHPDAVLVEIGFFTIVDMMNSLPKEMRPDFSVCMCGRIKSPAEGVACEPVPFKE